MSNWIEDEGQRFSDELAEKTRKKQVIAMSNYWVALLDQLKADVATINENVHWKQHLGNIPIKVSGFSGGLQIAKETLPAMVVHVTNEGDTVQVQTEIYNSKGSPSSTKKKKYPVVVSDTLTCISDDEALWVIPEEASRHILTPLLEFMKVESR